MSHITFNSSGTNYVHNCFCPDGEGGRGQYPRRPFTLGEGGGRGAQHLAKTTCVRRKYYNTL